METHAIVVRCFSCLSLQAVPTPKTQLGRESHDVMVLSSPSQQIPSHASNLDIPARLTTT
jgi:hypothetical protein